MRQKSRSRRPGPRARLVRASVGGRSGLVGGGGHRVLPARSRRRRLARSRAPPVVACAPAIIRPSTSREVPAGDLADDPAAVHAPRSGRRAPSTSSSSVETTITAAPVSRSRDDPLVDELDRADVERRGWAGRRRAAAAAGTARGRARPSAGCRRTGSPAGGRRCDGVRTSNSLDPLLGVLARSRARSSASRADERRAVVAGRAPGSRRRRSCRPGRRAAGPRARSRRRRRGSRRWTRPATSVPSSVIEPLTSRLQARRAPRPARSGRCPARRRCAKISPARTSKRHVVDRTTLAAVVDDGQVRDRRAPTSPGCAGVLVDRRAAPARPTISEASSALVAVGSASPTTLPRRMTVIRSATAAHLAQLVGDEDDRRAAVLAARA